MEKTTRSIISRIVFCLALITVQAPAAQQGGKDNSLEALRLTSAQHLTRFGQLLSAYAADNDGRLCTHLSELGKYVTLQDDVMFHYVEVKVEYLGAGKTNRSSPKTTVVAFDRSLPPQAGGTNVLFADGHVEFIRADRLPGLGITFRPRQTTAQADGSETYEVRFADDWQPYVSAGHLKIVGQPFYAVRTKFFAASAYVRIQWSLTNRSEKPIIVRVQYRTTPTKGKGGSSGSGGAYALASREERLIDDIVPIASKVQPVTFYVVAEALYDGQYNTILSSRHQIMASSPVQFRDQPANSFMARDETAKSRVKDMRLTRSPDQGNVLEVEAGNETDHALPLVLRAAAAFPAKGPEGEGGDPIFCQTTATVGANSTSVLRLPYAIPQSRPDPFLVFTLLEGTAEPGKNASMSRSDIQRMLLTESRLQPLYWGWLDLREAAAKGLVKLPAFEPVKERIKLTGRKQSEHFLFRYRPGSYAEEHIDTAVKDREEAYQRLSTMLQMQLPKVVTIDLYSDMEAKGLGSGTTWTHANTVTNTQIAEVYNVADQCDRYHELAHVFSYHFAGQGMKSAEGPLLEGFADFCEDHNMDLGPAREAVRQELAKGTLKPLVEVVLKEPPAEPAFTFFDFLIRKDVEKFKTWYFRVVTEVKTEKDLEKACRDIYGTGLKEIEQQWHGSLNAAGASKAASDRDQAVMKTFEEFQNSVKTANYEAAWGLLASSFRAQFQNDIEKFKGQMGPDDPPRTAFLSLRPESVTEDDKSVVLTARYENQTWKILFVQEDGRWKIYEGQADRGN